MSSVVTRLALLALLVSLAAVPAVAGTAPVNTSAATTPSPSAGFQAPAIRPVVQVRHVPRAELTFAGRFSQDGAFEIEARGGDLVLQKRSLPAGGFALELTAPKDSVSIAFSDAGVTVSRNKRRRAVSLSADSLEELDGIRRLLAGSEAIRLTRTAASAVQESEDDSLASTSLLIADALVGLLTGDDGAAARTSKHLSRHARAGIRRVATPDCYTIWEGRVVRAGYEWESCARSFSIWNPVRNLCAFRWVLAVESYWFSFLSCSGLNSF
ncbi:MAG: hypothetical protein AB7F99_13790 [Vicinamibacterales bacterium]